MTVKVEPTEFSTYLKMLQPALDVKGILPILSYLCFGESEEHGPWALAYNDSLGIVVFNEAFEDLECAVPGDILIRSLGTFYSQVEFEQDKDSLVIKQGKTRMKLPILDASSYLFAPPDEVDGEIIYGEDTAGVAVPLDGEALKAMEMLVKVSGENPMYDVQLGITIDHVGDAMHLYSTDNKTLTKITIEDHETESGEVQANLPLGFCKQVLSLARNFGYDKEGEVMLYIDEESEQAFCLFLDASRKYLAACAFTKLNLSVDVEAFEDVLGHNAIGKIKPVAPPLGLDDCLNRASIVAGKDSSDSRIEVTLKDSFMHLRAEAFGSEVKDALPFKGPGMHTHVFISAPNWLRGLEFEPKKMAILPHSIYLKSEVGNTIIEHLVATTS